MYVETFELRNKKSQTGRDTIAVTCYPAENKKSENPIVLLHGMWCTGWVFHDWAQVLCENRDVYVPELRGHGGSVLSSKPLGHMTIADYFYDACQVLEWIPYTAGKKDRFKAVSVIGHSMGGLLSLKLSEVYGCRSIAINPAPPRGVMHHGWSSFFLPKYLWSILRKKSFLPSAFDRRILLGNGLSQKSASMVPESGQVALDILLGGLAIARMLRPTTDSLVISGGADRMTSPMVHLNTSKMLSTRFCYFPNMSHMAMCTPDSDRCMKKIERHLSRAE